MQVKPANGLEDALEIMDKASSVNSMDAAGITSIVQASDDDDNSDSGAPDAAVYGKSQWRYHWHLERSLGGYADRGFMVMACCFKIGGLSADIATDEADLKAATGIRE